MNRDELINGLVTNCDCFKGDKTTLQSFTDEKLKGLHELTQRAAEGEAIVNGLQQGVVVNGIFIQLDEDGELMVSNADDDDDDMEDDDDEDDDDDTDEFVENDEEDDDDMEDVQNANCMEPDEDDNPVPTKKKGKKAQMTANQWLKAAPIEVQRLVANAMKVEEEQKISLIKQLVDNYRGDKEAKAQQLFEEKSLEDLEEMVELMPKANIRASKPVVNFFGAAGGKVDDSNEDMEELPVLTYNWNEDAETETIRKKIK